jgi:uncharacterized protein YecE (DUF72 family)
LIQLSPSFSIEYFNTLEKFLKNIPRRLEKIELINIIKKVTNNAYQYAIEFRHPSWNTEGPWELLRHYNIANVITDSPEKVNL